MLLNTRSWSAVSLFHFSLRFRENPKLFVYHSHTGSPPRDQGPRLLCSRDTTSLCTWRWPATVPLLHHPLTVEGQGGPPLSTGPAALIGAEIGLGVGDWVRWRGEEGLDPLTAPDHWSLHRLITTDPWSAKPAPPLSSRSVISHPWG